MEWLQQKRAQDRACNGAYAAEKTHQGHRDIKGRIKRGSWIDRADEVGPDGTGHANNERRDHKGGKLGDFSFHAQAERAILVIATSQPPEDVFRVTHPPRNSYCDQQQDQNRIIERYIKKLPAPTARKRQVQSSCAVGDACHVFRKQLPDKEYSDGDDDKGMPAHSQGHPACRNGDKRRDQARYGYKQEDSIARRDIPVLTNQREGIGADAKENDVPQRKVASIARQHVPGRDHCREEQRKERDGSHLAVGKEQRKSDGKGQQRQKRDDFKYPHCFLPSTLPSKP